MAVKTPLSPIARAANAAAFSLISTALEVPKAWATRPSEKPLAASLLMFSHLKTTLPNNTPKSPVIAINPIDKETIAPISCATIIPIGAW